MGTNNFAQLISGSSLLPFGQDINPARPISNSETDSKIIFVFSSCVPFLNVCSWNHAVYHHLQILVQAGRQKFFPCSWSACYVLWRLRVICNLIINVNSSLIFCLQRFLYIAGFHRYPRSWRGWGNSLPICITTALAVCKERMQECRKIWWKFRKSLLRANQLGPVPQVSHTYSLQGTS